MVVVGTNFCQRAKSDNHLRQRSCHMNFIMYTRHNQSASGLRSRLGWSDACRCEALWSWTDNSCVAHSASWSQWLSAACCICLTSNKYLRLLDIQQYQHDVKPLQHQALKWPSWWLTNKTNNAQQLVICSKCKCGHFSHVSPQQWSNRSWW